MGYFAAGVPSIIASQWKVDSESTTKLMLALYRDLKLRSGSPLATARSLQQSALKLLHDPHTRIRSTGQGSWSWETRTEIASAFSNHFCATSGDEFRIT